MRSRKSANRTLPLDMPTNKKRLRLGIIAAMPQEICLFQQRFKAARGEKIGPREFVRAETESGEVIVTMSHIGKVAAATTATLLVHRFGVEGVVFTGVGGGVSGTIGVGDIIVADYLIQHDIDLKGVLGFERFVVPSLGVARIAANKRFLEVAKDAARAVVADPDYTDAIKRLVRRDPTVHVGLVGSGDRFIGNSEERRALVEAIPDLLAVEMEGASVAQVCAEHNIPFVVSRIISDAANSEAHVDFTAFIEQAAALGSECFVREFLRRV